MYTTHLQPQTETQANPVLGNQCSYDIQQDRVIVNIDTISNPRPLDNISGTLAIEVWALKQPYDGDDFSGEPLAGTGIGQIFGQYALNDCRYDLIFQAPPAGTWHVVLMLREWTELGYVTRDFFNFPQTYTEKSSSAVVQDDSDNIISVEFTNIERPVVAFTGEADVKVKDVKVETKIVKASRSKGEKDDLVSLNEASAKEIAAIKGVSKKLAHTIVEHRPYTSFNEVLKLKGMGAKLLDKIRAFVKL